MLNTVHSMNCNKKRLEQFVSRSLNKIYGRIARLSSTCPTKTFSIRGEGRWLYLWEANWNPRLIKSILCQASITIWYCIVDHFNLISLRILLFQQHGLIDYAAKRNFKKWKAQKFEETARVFILYDFTGSFLILLLGISASIAAIIAEILMHRYMARKNLLIYFVL